MRPTFASEPPARTRVPGEIVRELYGVTIEDALAWTVSPGGRMRHPMGAVWRPSTGDIAVKINGAWRFGGKGDSFAAATSAARRMLAESAAEAAA